MERKLSSKGGLTIPKDMRMALGLRPKEKIELKSTKEGNVLICRLVGSCILCGSSENLIKHNGKYICQDCLEHLQQKQEAR